MSLEATNFDQNPILRAARTFLDGIMSGKLNAFCTHVVRILYNRPNPPKTKQDYSELETRLACEVQPRFFLYG